MIRTQVYLPKALYRRIRLRAAQAGEPAAQLVRELLEASLTTAAGETPRAALLRLVAIGGQGPADLSAQIDAYLYEHSTR